MKVYTTEEREGTVVLTVYKSMKAFTSENKWCDPKFINVATTKDLDGFEFANEKSMIVYTDIENESRLMLRDIFLNGDT